MTRVAWFNCQAGVAGDMTMAALVDAGADPDDVAGAVGALGVDGYALAFETVQRCGVRATWANVVLERDVLGGHDQGRDDHGHDDHRHDDHERDVHGRDDHESSPDPQGRHHHHLPGRRRVADIYLLLDAAPLAARVRDRAGRVFAALAAVEGAIHGVDPDEVELHEVGSLDSIIDVVGACAALESLGVDRVVCGPLGVGTGSITSAHGPLPNPAPATLGLLAGSGIATTGVPTSLEMATPTGVALMVALGDDPGPMPPISIESVGYGAGTADPPERANVVQVVIGESRDAPVDDPGALVTLLEVNVDDVTPEVVAHAISRLLADGAHDAWATPIVMKKGRPAFTVAALCDPTASSAMRATLLAETGSLGARATQYRRWPQRRQESSVVVDGHTIAVKVAEHRVKIEFDDAVRAAEALGRPVREVLEAARRAAGSAD